eukprot:Gb_30553 [translate_table: standard]
MSIPKVDPDSSLGEALMGLYENMGDTLALQYGGSAAHNKVFSERRGRWKATTHSQEFFRTLQRYYRNAYLDAEKQDAINVFLGHFQPQHGKPALWELDSDQHCNIGRRIDDFVNKDMGSSFKRSLSDGNILNPNVVAVSTQTASQNHLQGKMSLTERSLVSEGTNSTPEHAITCIDETSYARFVQSTTCRRLLNNCRNQPPIKLTENGRQGIMDRSTNSEFHDFDWLASSGNSCEEDSSERCLVTTTLDTDSSNRYTVHDTIAIHEGSNEYDETSQGTNGMEKTNGGVQGNNTSDDFHQADHSLGEVIAQAALNEFSSTFVHWVNYGQSLCS